MMAILCSVLLLFLLYKQHDEKQKYESYLSQQLSNEISYLITELIRSDSVYKDILSSEKITKLQAMQLSNSSNTILTLSQKYEDFAVSIKRMDSDRMDHQTAISAQAIGRYFSAMLGPYQVEQNEADQILMILDSGLRVKMEQLHALNTYWLSASEDDVAGVSLKEGQTTFNTEQYHKKYGRNSISNDFWVDLVADLNTKTKVYLTENYIQNLEELLK